MVLNRCCRRCCSMRGALVVPNPPALPAPPLAHAHSNPRCGGRSTTACPPCWRPTLPCRCDAGCSASAATLCRGALAPVCPALALRLRAVVRASFPPSSNRPRLSPNHPRCSPPGLRGGAAAAALPSVLRPGRAGHASAAPGGLRAAAGAAAGARLGCSAVLCSAMLCCAGRPVTGQALALHACMRLRPLVSPSAFPLSMQAGRWCAACGAAAAPAGRRAACAAGGLWGGAARRQRAAALQPAGHRCAWEGGLRLLACWLRPAAPHAVHSGAGHALDGACCSSQLCTRNLHHPQSCWRGPERTTPPPPRRCAAALPRCAAAWPTPRWSTLASMPARVRMQGVVEGSWAQGSKGIHWVAQPEFHTPVRQCGGARWRW